MGARVWPTYKIAGRNFYCLSVGYETYLVFFSKKSLVIVIKKITFVPPLDNRGTILY